MALKSFKHEENQKLWEKFYEFKFKDIPEEKKVKLRMSVNQYKPGLLRLEEMSDKKFEDIIPEDITEVMLVSKVGHITAFFSTVITEGWIKADKKLIMYLIPKEYKGMVKLLVN